jgi:hypothetical protein
MFIKGEPNVPVSHFNNLFILSPDLFLGGDDFTLSCLFSVDEVDLHFYQQRLFSALDLNKLFWKNKLSENFSPEFLAKNVVIVDFDSAERFIIEVTIVITITVLLTIAAFVMWDNSLKAIFESVDRRKVK